MIAQYELDVEADMQLEEESFLLIELWLERYAAWASYFGNT